MKRAIKLAIVSLVLFAQFAFLIIWYNPYPHGDMIDVSYRHQQRRAAYGDYLRHPSPDTGARLEAETKRMQRYERVMTAWELAMLLLINGFGIYYFLDYRDRARKPTADNGREPANRSTAEGGE